MAKIKHLENKFSIASYELIKACKPLELKFYLFLKLWAIQKHSAFPSYNTIIAELEITQPTLTKLIKDLEQLRRLKVERIAGRNSIYDITWYDNLVKDTAMSLEETMVGSTKETLVESTKETLDKRIYNKTNNTTYGETSSPTTTLPEKKPPVSKEIYDRILSHYKAEYYKYFQKIPAINYPRDKGRIKELLNSKILSVDEICELITAYRNGNKIVDHSFDLPKVLTSDSISKWHNNKL